MKRLSPREGYDLYAGDYRQDHPHLDSFMDGAETRSWTGALTALLAERPRVRAVDVGCGDGRTLGRWRRRVEKEGWGDRVELWGTDLSPRMVEAARGRVKEIRWEVLDLGSPAEVSTWRLAHGPADLVSAWFVLVHFDRVERFFAGALGLMAPGSRLVMNTIPQPKAPQLRAQGKPIVIEAWDHGAEEVVARGGEAGLRLTGRQDFRQGTEVISTLLEWVL
jgi:ubiquinone/menaquinone biosynthesis C-methylase UbiE